MRSPSQDAIHRDPGSRCRDLVIGVSLGRGRRAGVSAGEHVTSDGATEERSPVRARSVRSRDRRTARRDRTDRTSDRDRRSTHGQRRAGLVPWLRVDRARRHARGKRRRHAGGHAAERSGWVVGEHGSSTPVDVPDRSSAWYQLSLCGSTRGRVGRPAARPGRRRSVEAATVDGASARGHAAGARWQTAAWRCRKAKPAADGCARVGVASGHPDSATRPGLHGLPG